MSVVRFLVVGAANTAVGYGVILFAHYVLGLGHVAANTAGYVVGACVAYLGHRSFSFNSRRSHGSAIPLFAGTVLGCFLLNLVVLQICISVLGLPPPLAQALAIGSYTAAFYLVSRHLVFRH